MVHAEQCEYQTRPALTATLTTLLLAVLLDGDAHLAADQRQMLAELQLGVYVSRAALPVEMQHCLGSRFA